MDGRTGGNRHGNDATIVIYNNLYGNRHHQRMHRNSRGYGHRQCSAERYGKFTDDLLRPIGYANGQRCSVVCMEHDRNNAKHYGNAFEHDLVHGYRNDERLQQICHGYGNGKHNGANGGDYAEPGKRMFGRCGHADGKWRQYVRMGSAWRKRQYDYVNAECGYHRRRKRYADGLQHGRYGFGKRYGKAKTNGSGKFTDDLFRTSGYLNGNGSDQLYLVEQPSIDGNGNDAGLEHEYGICGNGHDQRLYEFGDSFGNGEDHSVDRAGNDCQRHMQRRIGHADGQRSGYVCMAAGWKWNNANDHACNYGNLYGNGHDGRLL
jgi:hypothetical protein